jgi:uncharacterized damage-inducible protein DinB
MDLLDRLLGHDVWTTRELLERCRPLSDEEFDREFPIGLHTLRRTFTHVIWNMEAWSDAIGGVPLREKPGPSETTVPALRRRLDRAGEDLARAARDVADRGGWDERRTEVGSEKTSGGMIAHVITHSMHHRAQLIFMLRELGVEDLPEGDVLSWESQLGG